ncbi:MAG: glycosyltransferase family 2 protein [Pseudomonadota bacterium]
MSLSRISVYIITKNEEQNLSRLLPLLSDFNEVVIVDCGSTDKTEDIARQHDNVRFMHQDWLGFAAQKEFAKNQCRNDWVLNLDADETFDDAFIKDIEKTVQADKADGLTCYCAETLLGYKKPHPLTKHQRKLRFFRKEKGHYPTVSVHEKIELTGKIAESNGKIYNWGTEIEAILAKQNLYSSLAAEDKFKAGKKPSLIKLVGRSPIAFIKFYVLKRQFLNGLEGFIAARNYSYYSFQKEAKLCCLYKKDKAE